MNTKLVNSAAGVILAALTGNRTAAGIALALDSAQLLLTPETVAELKELRERVAELEGPVAVHRRQGYEAAIEVMRQEKLPMSVGLLEAQLELNVLDGLAADVTVFRASHDSIPMGLYSNREAAQAHCEAKVRQEEPPGSIRHLSWSADDIGEDAEYELHITPAETGELIRGTGYVVTPLAVAAEYDEEADE